MGKNFKKVFIIFLALVTLSGCVKKKNQSQQSRNQPLLKNFKIDYIGENKNISIIGSQAMAENTNQTSISNPAIAISTGNIIVKISTTSDGNGEIFLDPKTQQPSKIIIQADRVTINQENLKTKNMNFTAFCKKLTYMKDTSQLILDGNPEIFQGQNKYKANQIVYDINKNKIVFSGSVKIYYVEKNTPSGK
jgi:lipopolysaccharide export system protein LptA